MNSALYVPRIDEASGSGWTISRIRVTSYLYKQLTIRLALCLSLLLSCTWLSATPWTATYQASLPWRELSLRVGSNSCSMSQWRYLTISSSAAPFSSGPQSFPSSGFFPVSWLFASGGQSIGTYCEARGFINVLISSFIIPMMKEQKLRESKQLTQRHAANS